MSSMAAREKEVGHRGWQARRGLHGSISRGLVVGSKEKQLSSWRGTGVNKKGAQLLL